ncbi:MAG: DDE-type integrase/transposase/recombinase [Gammaproteobacteria bacterium]|nr:DDE-type integrase/transposase/recombinase [Gammaproteobacteria bacterium]
MTHVGGQAYLTAVDSASRFTVWRSMRNESAREVRRLLLETFMVIGPPEEILTDNGLCFRGEEVRRLLVEWEVRHRFAGAYRPQGNGLCERSHRTIKTSVERARCTVEEAVFWYNATKGERQASPYVLMFGAMPRMPGVRKNRENADRPPMQHDDEDAPPVQSNPFVVGDRVFLRQTSRCDEPWSGPHRVTEIKSNVIVELNNDGVARHVSHVRRVPASRPLEAAVDHSDNSDEDSDTGQPVALGDNNSDEEDEGPLHEQSDEEGAVRPEESVRSRRDRRPPRYWKDYYV